MRKLSAWAALGAATPILGSQVCSAVPDPLLVLAGMVAAGWGLSVVLAERGGIRL